jgi:hypothetical protein
VLALDGSTSMMRIGRYDGDEPSLYALDARLALHLTTGTIRAVPRVSSVRGGRLIGRRQSALVHLQRLGSFARLPGRGE